MNFQTLFKFFLLIGLFASVFSERLMSERELCLPRLIEDGRREFKQKYKTELEGLTTISQQVVSGLRYRIDYSWKDKGGFHRATIDGYCVPWTGHR